MRMMSSTLEELEKIPPYSEGKMTLEYYHKIARYLAMVEKKHLFHCLFLFFLFLPFSPPLFLFPSFSFPFFLLFSFPLFLFPVPHFYLLPFLFFLFLLIFSSFINLKKMVFMNIKIPKFTFCHCFFEFINVDWF